MKTKPTTLTAADVRGIIEQTGTGDNFTAKLENIAKQTNVPLRTLWRYATDGVPQRSKLARAALERLARKAARIG